MLEPIEQGTGKYAKATKSPNTTEVFKDWQPLPFGKRMDWKFNSSKRGAIVVNHCVTFIAYSRMFNQIAKIAQREINNYDYVYIRNADGVYVFKNGHLTKIK